MEPIFCLSGFDSATRSGVRHLQSGRVVCYRIADDAAVERAEKKFGALTERKSEGEPQRKRRRGRGERKKSP